MFATPRGWEDLSRLLEVYEKLDKPVDREVVLQYIQYPKAAKDFANYLELYRKYQTDYQIEAVLSGNIDPILGKKVAHASFDEKLSVIGLLLSGLFRDFKEYFEKENTVTCVYQTLKEFRESNGDTEQFERMVLKVQVQREEKKKAKSLTAEEEKCSRAAQEILECCLKNMKENGDNSHLELFEEAKAVFQKEKEKLQNLYDKASQELEHALDFMESVFGESQEMVVFITELNGNYYSVQFMERYSCKRYYHWNGQLLFGERHKKIQEKMEKQGFSIDKPIFRE